MAETNDDRYSLRYFLAECVRFREAFGTKAFWALPLEQRRRALFGIQLVAGRCRTTNEEEESDLLIALECHTREYIQRAHLMRCAP